MDPKAEVIRWIALIGGTIGIGALIDRLVSNRILNRPGRSGNMSDAQTAHELADARLALAQADSETVKAVREALAEVREISASKDRQIERLNERLDRQADDIRYLQRQGHRIQVALSAHGQWDLMMAAEVRKHNSDFPEPPPLGDFDIWVERDKQNNGGEIPGF